MKENYQMYTKIFITKTLGNKELSIEKEAVQILQNIYLSPHLTAKFYSENEKCQ